MIALVAAALAVSTATAPVAPAAGGWITRGSSLLLLDADGQFVQEIGLVSSEDSSVGGKILVKETLGGAAKSRRVAWTMERTRVYNASRSKLLDSKRTLKLLGTRGEEIWTSAEADAEEKLDPVVFSDDGETLLLSLRGKDGWRVQAKGYLGNLLMELYPAPELEDMRLTPDGRFAMIRWAVPDKEATHTFWNLPAKARKDVPSSELHLGRATLENDGRVLSNGKLVLNLAEAAPAAPPKQ